MKLKPIIAVLVFAVVPNTVFANETLMKSKGCLSCHQVNKKVIGPSFKDVATVYSTESNAKQRFVKLMKEGSKGKWGVIPMPPQSTLTSTDLNTMFEWISKQK